MTPTYIRARITAIEAIILVYEAAILALAVDGIQDYDLDTGQTRQKVTKLDLDHLNKVLHSLYNQLTIFQVRLNGGGSIIGKPQW